MEVNNFDGCKILLGALDILLPLTMLTYFRCGEHFVLPVYIFPGSYTGGNICSEQETCICMRAKVMHHLLHKPRAYGIDSVPAQSLPG